MILYVYSTSQCNFKLTHNKNTKCNSIVFYKYAGNHFQQRTNHQIFPIIRNMSFPTTHYMCVYMTNVISWFVCYRLHITDSLLHGHVSYLMVLLATSMLLVSNSVLLISIVDIYWIFWTTSWVSMYCRNTEVGNRIQTLVKNEKQFITNYD